MRGVMKISFLALITIILSACEKDEQSDVKADKNLILELNNKALSIITVDSHEYFLESYLWRDFMPISPPNGKPLASVNWLISRDSISIPDNIEMIKQYVINNDSVWIANYEDGLNTGPDYKIKKISRNGPKWGPGINVDIISKIMDKNTNQDFYLIQKDVLIGRTD